MAAALESLALKRLRSFALFSAKKRLKYEAACDLFGQAAAQYLKEDNVDKAAECCKQQARLCINKLQQPVESAMHYMEATRAYMLGEEYSLAFQCLQLAVQARTHPKIKHKFDNPHAAIQGITVLEGPPQQTPPLLLTQSSDTTGTASARTPDQQQQHQQQSSSASLSQASSLTSSPTRSPPQPSHAALFLAAQGGGSSGSASGSALDKRSPALTGQAGTISAEGKSLFLSPDTMYAPISSREGRSASTLAQPNSALGTFNGSARSISIQPHPSPAANHSDSNAAAAAAAAAVTESCRSAEAASSSSSSGSSSSFLTVPTSSSVAQARKRRHSLSGSANSSNVTVEGVVHDVLHLDLLLARLAVQLAADLWVHLDFRDAILSLEIASSLFATLLIAERHFGTFRRSTKAPGVVPSIVSRVATIGANQAALAQYANTLPSSSSSSGANTTASAASATTILALTGDPVPMVRAESASSPNTPLTGAMSPPPTSTDASTLAIQERLAGLLGPSAYSTSASSQTLGTLSSRPLSTRPIPSLLAVHDESDPLFSSGGDARRLVLHQADPFASVGEGEGALSDHDPGTTILEESLVCRVQLAMNYVSFDEELREERSFENQELRRSKALFEQVASQKPDHGLLHATLLPVLDAALHSSLTPPHTGHRDLDDLSTLISEYTADDDKLHACLFLAGLCDLLVGIRVYIASQGKDPSTPTTTGGKKGDPSSPPGANPSSSSRPAVPELYLAQRTVHCPPILLRYRDMCASFGWTPEVRLLRALAGLLQMAASLNTRLSDAFGGPAPRVAKQLFQAAWGAEIIREFAACVEVFTRQRPLTATAAKLLVQIKKQAKIAIAL